MISVQRLGTLPVYDDPDGRKGCTLRGTFLRLLMLAVLCAVVAAVASRIMG